MQETTSKKSKTLKKKKTTKKKSKGLGDTIAKVTKATGIDKAVKFIAGEDCGCTERRKALNKLFPYNKPECLKEDEYSYLKEFYKIHKNRWAKNPFKSICEPQKSQIRCDKKYEN